MSDDLMIRYCASTCAHSNTFVGRQGLKLGNRNLTLWTFFCIVEHDCESRNGGKRTTTVTKHISAQISVFRINVECLSSCTCLTGTPSLHPSPRPWNQHFITYWTSSLIYNLVFKRNSVLLTVLSILQLHILSVTILFSVLCCHVTSLILDPSSWCSFFFMKKKRKSKNPSYMDTMYDFLIVPIWFEGSMESVLKCTANSVKK